MKKIIISIVLFLILLFGYIFIRPSIVLEGKDINISYKEKYEEPGYKATFLNKDISKKVIVTNNIDYKKTGTYLVTYKVKWLFSNIEETRKVKVIDDDLPTISLKGGKTFVYLNDAYNELGFIATDELDGEITNKVSYNKIDTSKTGNYVITYKVKDSSNNEVSVNREVIVLEKKYASSIPVLMYHFFYDKTKNPTTDANYTEITKFEEQIKYIKENNYYIPSWDELQQFIDNKIKLPEKSIIITVDDGSETFFYLAIPILQKYDINATSFIISSWYDKNTLKDIINTYDTIDFQSHTHDMHRGGCSGGHGGLFRCIDYEDGMNDLKKSKEYLGKNDVMCYPFGDFTDNTLRITKDSGYKLGFTTEYGKVKPGMDKLKLPRIRISNNMSLNDFINSI